MLMKGHNSGRIKIHDNYLTLASSYDIPNYSQIQQFQDDGFTVFPQVLTQESVNYLNHELELVLRGNYDTNIAPDKHPKLIKQPMPSAHNNYYHALGYSGQNRSKVFQIINIHKSNSLFHELVHLPTIGKMVATLMNWKNGARLAQDQVWAKPTGSKPLVYHRDSPYFMFDPDDVATVWIALDDMEEENGPLSYVKGSHKWGDGRWGSAQYFFMEDGGEALLFSAADRAGVDKENLEYISMKGLLAGGLSIHHGKTWHGSGSNTSNGPRRGIGLHFVPVDVRWTEDAIKSSLWKPYVGEIMSNGGNVSEIPVCDIDFPIIWRPDNDAKHVENSNHFSNGNEIMHDNEFHGYFQFQDCCYPSSTDEDHSGKIYKFAPLQNGSHSEDEDSYDETQPHEEIFVVHSSLAFENNESAADNDVLDFEMIANQALASLDSDYKDTFKLEYNMTGRTSDDQQYICNIESSLTVQSWFQIGDTEENDDHSKGPKDTSKVDVNSVKEVMKKIELTTDSKITKKFHDWKSTHTEYAICTAQSNKIDSNDS